MNTRILYSDLTKKSTRFFVKNLVKIFLTKKALFRAGLVWKIDFNLVPIPLN